MVGQHSGQADPAVALHARACACAAMQGVAVEATSAELPPVQVLGVLRTYFARPEVGNYRTISGCSSGQLGLIRDGKLDKNLSIRQFKTLLAEIKEQYNQKKAPSYNSDKWVFPLKGYTIDISIGNSKDEGYIPGRYDFFDGNEHKGHAALDIFITDSNQDCIDDRTKKPVDILSLTSGVVLATETNWDTASSNHHPRN